jgi:hypothetical protein
MDSPTARLRGWRGVAFGLLLGLAACSEAPPPSASQTGAVDRETVHGAAPPRSLEALPYVDGTFDPAQEKRGVLLHLPQKASAGLNLYCSRELGAALLLDMAGEIVHRWRFPSKGVDHCEALPDGGVLGLVQDRAVVALDRSSKVLWTHRAEVHHGFHRQADGTLWVLARRPSSRPDLHPTLRVYDELLQVLDGDGRLLREHSLLDAWLASPYRFLLPEVADRTFPGARNEPVLDLLHANHVEVLDGALEARSPLFARGNLLVSLRNLSAIAFLDPKAEQVLWVWGPNNLVYQHHPSLLPTGRILLFNNGVSESEVLEVDPVSSRVPWRYRAGSDFFSATRGSCQRLANGNTLVTESNTGYVFEVTPTGEKVWEWANPLILPGGKRAFVWRMTRLPLGSLPFPAGAPAPASAAPPASG